MAPAAPATAPAEPVAGESATGAPPEPSLSERVRALYEGGVVPVREIARLCGVTERTIYKYARKLAWSPRVTRLAGDGKPTAAKLAARGAGGRFIPLAHAGLPHAQGLKALDADGARVAASACARAEVLSDQAIADSIKTAQGRAARDAEERQAKASERMFELLAGSLAELAQLRAERRGRASPRAEELSLLLECVILRQMETLSDDWRRSRLRTTNGIGR
jgi:hypothetical protein